MKKIALILTIFILVACGPAKDQETINIGVFEPLSGLYKESGTEILRGVQLAHKEKQYVLGKKIRLEVYDTKSLEFESANAVSYLSSRDLTAMIGTYGVESMAHALPVIEAAQVPTISSGSTYSKILQSEWTSSLSMNDVHQATAMARFAEEYLHLKNIAVLVDEEFQYGQDLAYTFSHQVSPSTKTHIIPYHTGDTTFRSQIRTLEGLSIDGVYCPGDPEVSGHLVRAIRTRFPYMTILGGDRWENPSFYKKAGEASQGVYFTAHYSPKKLTSSRGAQFIAAYTREYGEKPNSFSALGYDSYIALVHSIDQAQSQDPYKIQYHIRRLKGFPGATERLSVDYQADELRPVKILQQNGPSAYWYKTIEVKN